MTQVNAVGGVYDVVIVGGGPVGLLVSNELALHGVSAIVLEQRDSVSEHPRAGTYHARAVASLTRRGILGMPRRTTDHRVVATEPFQFAGYPWITLRSRLIDGPVMLGIAQADLERAIAVRAAASGAGILRGHTVVGVEQDGDGARVVAVGPDGSVAEYRARYVVGADGARSVVRESGEFDVREYQPTMRAMLGLVDVPRPEQLPAGWAGTPRGWTLLNYNPYGASRLIVFEFDGPTPDRGAPVTPGEFREAVNRVAGTPVDLVSPRNLSRFSDYSRVASRYRDGRMFLAGDAAHIHYPLGGQGLNAGIDDAVNLGWKLAAVVTGAAGDGLLETYGTEREPVGRWLIDNTRLQAMLMNPGAAWDPLRDVVRSWLAQLGPHDWVADRINGTALRYGPGGAGARPFEGEFLPDFELRVDGETVSVSRLLHSAHLLVLVPDAVLDRVRAVVRGPIVRPVPVAGGIPAGYPDIIVVRPDGYVAWTGGVDDLDGMRDHLARRYALRLG
ncbi:FAD-dependent monooxygenase [Corynebacterium bovis]|uniref:FAD-dependent monooxygenase n=1 Tax=Corynebacterium bovis TaxID=36808 RepID=UPI003139E3A8